MSYMNKILVSFVYLLILFSTNAHATDKVYQAYKSIEIGINDSEALSLLINPRLHISLSAEGLNIEDDDNNFVIPLTVLRSISKGEPLLGTNKSGMNEVSEKPLFVIENNRLEIFSHSNQMFSICSYDGKLIYSNDIIGRFSFDLATLNKGVYILSIAGQSIKLKVK